MNIFEKKTVRIKKNTFLTAGLLFVTVSSLIMLWAVLSGEQYENNSPQPLEDTENIELIQLNGDLSAGRASAVISTSEGDITAVLYDKEAPNAVGIFKSSAREGIYNGLPIGLYELGSVFTADVPEREEKYTAELHKNLWPFKGALCMNENCDLIFINTVEYSDEDKEYLGAEGEMSEVRAAFLEYGGVPNYSRLYTVFGQVTDGIDVLEKIAGSPAGSNITINSVTISEEDPN